MNVDLPAEMGWECAALDALHRAIEGVLWDPQTKVALVVDDFPDDEPHRCVSVEDLIERLQDVYGTAWTGEAPFDSGEMVFEPDFYAVEEYVRAACSDQIKAMGWT